MPIISWQKTMIIKTFIKDKQKREIYGFPKRRYEKRTYRCVLQLYELRRLIRTAFGGAFFMNNDSI